MYIVDTSHLKIPPCMYSQLQHGNIQSLVEELRKRGIFTLEDCNYFSAPHTMANNGSAKIH